VFVLPPTVGLAAVPEFIERSARNRSPIEKLKLKLRTNADRYSSAGTTADSEPKDEDLFVSRHRSKPIVVSRFILSN